MKRGALVVVAAAAWWVAPSAALGASSTTDDRIVVSADGATLTGTNGGAGASLGWLHNFDADSLAGVAVEHQGLGSARWSFGSVNGSLSRGSGNQRYGVYGEAHEGTGDDGPRAFKYRIEAAGVTGTFFHRVTAQLENKRIDVESTHGNLPKIGISYLWDPHVLTSVSYSYSVSGNLGTRLTAARIDRYGATMNFLAGVAFGQAAPAIILNFQSGLAIPGRQLHEGYVGASKPFPRQRSELSLVADYQNLSGIKHATLALAYIVHVGATGTRR